MDNLLSTMMAIVAVANTDGSTNEQLCDSIVSRFFRSLFLYINVAMLFL